METHRRRPSLSPADAKDDIGIQTIGAAMTTMTMTGAELCIPTLTETLRPSSASGKKKQWHKKKASPPTQEIHILRHIASEDTHHSVILHGSSGDAESTTTSTTWPMVDVAGGGGGGGKTNATATKATTNKNSSGEPLQLKNKKPVVVEISSAQLHNPKKKPMSPSSAPSASVWQRL